VARERRTQRALTTGQAARFCLVTSDTIVNWIKNDNLPARRTLGGQHRILVDDLRAYMIAHEMNTDLLDEDFGTHCYCWQHLQDQGLHPIYGEHCEDCLVRRVVALHCFELRSSLSKKHDEIEVCAGCPYIVER